MRGFDILGDAFFADPYPTLGALRREAPCWYDPRLGAWVVTRYRDVQRVLKDPQFSSERVSQFGRHAPEHLREKLGVYTEELERWLLFRDPPEHTPLRRRLGRLLGPRSRGELEVEAARAAAAAVAVLGATEAPDVVRDLAYPVPTVVLSRMLGIPSEDIELFKQWTTDIFALIGAGVADAPAVELGYRGVTELRAYVLDLLRARRSHSRDDLLSDLTRGEDSVSDEDVVGLYMTMIVAGHETTTHLIANAVHGILSDPRARKQALAAGRITDAAVDELIRHDGSVFSLIRRARCDQSIAGQTVREGECVFAMLNAGNRDPEQFTDPDQLDFERPRPNHLGLGAGLHACIGAGMARTVVRVALGTFLEAWPEVSLAADVEWQRNMSIRGPSRLPVRLRPLVRPRPVRQTPSFRADAHRSTPET